MKPIARSGTFERTEAIGITRRGKKTFVTRFTFVTTDAEAIVTPLAKKSHGTMPARAKSAYGTPVTSIPPT